MTSHYLFATPKMLAKMPAVDNHTCNGRLLTDAGVRTIVLLYSMAVKYGCVVSSPYLTTNKNKISHNNLLLYLIQGVFHADELLNR